MGSGPDLFTLVQIEQIKDLKARYFRLLDTKQWDRWSDLFTVDAELVNPMNRATPLRGRAQIVETIAANLECVTTVHLGHTPEIELLSDHAARGTWALHDLLIGPMKGEMAGLVRLEGYGHYVDEYVRSDAGWQIARQELHRLHVTTTRQQRSPEEDLRRLAPRSRSQ